MNYIRFAYLLIGIGVMLFDGPDRSTTCTIESLIYLYGTFYIVEKMIKNKD